MCQGNLYYLLSHYVRDTVSELPQAGFAVYQTLIAIFMILLMLAIESAPWHVQHLADGQI